MAAPARLPREQVARLLEEGWGPTQIAKHLTARGYEGVTPNAISTFRRRHTDVPAKFDSTRKVPWKVHPDHQSSVYRAAILTWHQREEGILTSPERERNLLAVEARLKEAGLVIDYRPRRKNPWALVPARPGVDLGIVREPDGVPRPATTGPYANAHGVDRAS